MSTYKISIIRTDHLNSDFRMLVEMLDKYLSDIDGKDHSFYATYNGIENIQNAVVVYTNEQACGCGAIKHHSSDTAEIKRMFVKPDFRGLGIAACILQDLETWAKEIGYDCCILETGKKQTEALGLYKKAGYVIIPNYGQYADDDNSICMKKTLK